MPGLKLNGPKQFLRSTNYQLYMCHGKDLNPGLPREKPTSWWWEWSLRAGLRHDVQYDDETDCILLFLQLYKEIEICPKTTKLIRFDKAESCTLGYGRSCSVDWFRSFVTPQSPSFIAVDWSSFLSDVARHSTSKSGQNSEVKRQQVNRHICVLKI